MNLPYMQPYAYCEYVVVPGSLPLQRVLSQCTPPCGAAVRYTIIRPCTTLPGSGRIPLPRLIIASSFVAPALLFMYTDLVPLNALVLSTVIVPPFWRTP